MTEPETDGARERLFFALWPDAVLAEQMAALGQEVTGGRGRLIPPEKIHLTLAFLGWVDAETRACAETVADQVAVAPFTMTLTQIGHFRRSQVLWLGPAEMPEPLPRLVGALNAGLRDCGFEPPRRTFQAHVTLARKVRRGHTREVAALTWSIGRFYLVRSTLRSSGAQYEWLREWSLQEE